jgi:branched-chain amino acid transport system substrate-binding protein
MKLFRFFLPTVIIYTLLSCIVSHGVASQTPKDSDKVIKIGLLIQDNKSAQARYGAELAVLKANQNIGLNGRQFQLVTRSMEGPWGTGSKEAVNMIFKEEVWAVMGSHDGRNAHLVEQVTTKAHVVFVSAWASDPTLNQAFVPWYFSCVPNDLQQATAIFDEIYTKRRITKIAVISDDSYDSKLALKSFLKKTKTAGMADPLPLFFDNLNPDSNVLSDQIIKADIKAIVLFGKPLASKRFIQQMGQRKIDLPVFCSLSLLGENSYFNQKSGNMVLVSSGELLGYKGLDFQNEFKKYFDLTPDAIASYAFDGMNLIIEAIRNAGFTREKIQIALSKIRLEGVTGIIQFDERGNRLGTPKLMELKIGTQ